MNYITITRQILMEFGIWKPYKGSLYIISSIRYLSENKSIFLLVTKFLYPAIAKEFNTSVFCVEKNIRFVIETIWQKQHNEELLLRIFNLKYSDNRLTNKEFLSLLLHYIESMK